MRLHLARPSSGVGRLVGPGGAAPYWAYVWAGGAILARHVLDRPRTVRGRRVLDLGAGGGVVAIAAALAGAAEVLAAETDANGRAALELNAALNGVELRILGEDLLDGPPPAVDLVLVGDLFYEPGLAGRVLRFLDRCLLGGLEVLVGDPGREPLPLARLEPIARHSVRDFGDGPDEAPRPAAVYALRPSTSPDMASR